MTSPFWCACVDFRQYFFIVVDVVVDTSPPSQLPDITGKSVYLQKLVFSFYLLVFLYACLSVFVPLAFSSLQSLRP